jgi:hypothetical protein
MENIKSCNLNITDPLNDAGNCVGNNKETSTTLPNKECCPTQQNCTPWDLTENTDTCLIDSYINESINIGGAVVNVHKLLGVHEQGLLQDLTGYGSPISNGDHPNFPSSNAYDNTLSEWRSLQIGEDVKTKSYIGYDFGEIRLSNGRLRYGVETFVKKDITKLKIKQGCKSENRVTKIRVERSPDNDKWYGVALVDIEDCDGVVTVNFNKSVPSRFWRIRPIVFNGGENDAWVIQSLQMIDYEETSIENIQDRIFLENRDRDYSEFSIRLKGVYQPIDSLSYLSKFGFNTMLNSNQIFMEMSFSAIVAALGRPLVIGDIVQLPSETQYTPSLKPVLKYLEVTNISWSSGGFTPSWQPTLQRVILEPVMATQETQKIFGKLTPKYDVVNTSDVDDGSYDKPFQDIANISETINAEQNTMVPEKGTDNAGVQKLADELYDWADKQPNLDLSKLDRIRNGYGADALPPNGLPYTEGDDFPDNPMNGDYHRLTYNYVGMNIPARLHRYSSIKQRWIYLETDTRSTLKTKPIEESLKTPDTSTVTPMNDSDKEFENG